MPVCVKKYPLVEGVYVPWKNHAQYDFSDRAMKITVEFSLLFTFSQVMLLFPADRVPTNLFAAFRVTL